MFQKGYFDLKMVRECEFEVVVEIAVEYQAEKVAEIAEKRIFLKNQAKFESFFWKKKYYMLFYAKNKGSLLFVFFKILKSIFGQSLKNYKKSI